MKMFWVTEVVNENVLGNGSGEFIIEILLKMMKRLYQVHYFAPTCVVTF